MGVPRLQHVASAEWLDIGLDAGSEGGTLFDADSARALTHVTPGDPMRDETPWAQSGQHGTFVEFHGTRERPIQILATIYALPAALRAIYQQRDRFRTAVGRFRFYDDVGGTAVEYENCRLVRWDMPRRRAVIDSELGGCYEVIADILLMQTEV